MKKVNIHVEYKKDEDYYNFAMLTLVTSAMPAGKRWYTNPLCITFGHEFLESDLKVGDKLYATSELQHSIENIININRVEDTKCGNYKVKPTTETFKK